MGGPATAWATLEEAQQCHDCSQADVTVLGTMLTVASELLYRMSGRQFAGIVADTVRPCRRLPGVAPTAGWRWQIGWGNCGCGTNWGEWGTWPGSRRCTCGPISEITLGAYPLRDIVQVRIDGHVLSPSAYRIDDSRWLVRIDGDVWPVVQDLTADPATDADTFEVAFEWGVVPPASGQHAAAVLACELALAHCCPEKCRLPARVTSLTRQGVNLALLDPMDFLDKGMTGLYDVDLFLRTFNPHRLQRRSSVINPDVGRPVRRTATTPGS